MKNFISSILMSALLTVGVSVPAAAESILDRLFNVIIIIEPPTRNYPGPPPPPVRPCDCQKDRSCSK